MNDERDTADFPVDETLSQRYRELADEQVPGRLDAAVLDAARRASRPRYARSRAWTRPLAWAATVALSVALVLELTRVPDPGISESEAPLPAAVPAPESASVPGPTPVDADANAGKHSTIERKREPDAPAARLEQMADAQAGAVDFERREQDLLGRADRIAESQSNDSRELAAVSLGSNAAGCPDDATRDPERWLECIESLEKAGLDEAAAEQRERLREAFPDFEFR